MTRWLAYTLSIVFHPLFVLPYLYILSWITCGHLFDLLDRQNTARLIAYVLSSAVIMPFIGIFMLKQLGFISSLEMEDRQERIGPLIITGMLYCWLSINFYQSGGDVPTPMTMATIGATIALFVGFFLNNFFKISLHAIAMGGLITGTILILVNWSYGYVHIGNNYYFHVLLILISLLILCGLVLTSRMRLGAHNIYQIYHGFIVGAFGQLIALRIIM